MAPPLLAVTACGGGSPSDDFAQAEAVETTETTVGLLPCAEDRHMVVFDVIGFLTEENIELLGPWAGEGITPTPRPGTVELAQAYRALGYELLYLTTLRDDMDLHGQPVVDAMTQWLQSSGYPMDPGGGHLWVWNGATNESGQTWVAVTDELLRLAAEGVSIEVGHTENEDKALAMTTGGVPPERMYTLTPPETAVAGAPTSAPTTPIPNDDVWSLLPGVQQLPPVCQVG